MRDFEKKALEILSTMTVIRDNISEEDSLSSLGIDSLKMVELILSLEDMFNIRFEDSEMNPKFLVSVNDVFLLLEKYLGSTVR